MGIDIIVLDNAGHFLESNKYAPWREAFIPTQILSPPGEELVDQILQSIQEYGKSVHGLATFADSQWHYVAQAAQQLYLHAPPPDALRTATNKYLTSIFAGHEAYYVSSVDEDL